MDIEPKKRKSIRPPMPGFVVGDEEIGDAMKVAREQKKGQAFAKYLASIKMTKEAFLAARNFTREEKKALDECDEDSFIKAGAAAAAADAADARMEMGGGRQTGGGVVEWVSTFAAGVGVGFYVAKRNDINNGLYIWLDKVSDCTKLLLGNKWFYILKKVAALGGIFYAGTLMKWGAADYLTPDNLNLLIGYARSNGPVAFANLISALADAAIKGGGNVGTLILGSAGVLVFKTGSQAVNRGAEAFGNFIQKSTDDMAQDETPVANKVIEITVDAVAAISNMVKSGLGYAVDAHKRLEVYAKYKNDKKALELRDALQAMQTHFQALRGDRSAEIDAKEPVDVKKTAMIMEDSITQAHNDMKQILVDNALRIAEAGLGIVQAREAREAAETAAAEQIRLKGKKPRPDTAAAAAADAAAADVEREEDAKIIEISQDFDTLVSGMLQLTLGEPDTGSAGAGAAAGAAAGPGDGFGKGGKRSTQKRRPKTTLRKSTLRKPTLRKRASRNSKPYRTKRR